MEVFIVPLWLLLSIVIGIFASSKNRSSLGWFLASILTSPIICFIILLSINSIPRTSDKLDKLETKLPIKKTEAVHGDCNERTCPFCAEIIKKSAILCRYCGQEIPKEKMNADINLFEGIVSRNYGKVNSAIYLGADVNAVVDGKSIISVAREIGDNAIIKLIEKAIAEQA